MNADHNFCCPYCKKPLLLHSDGNALVCVKCLRKFPIKEDIPDFLFDYAGNDDNPFLHGLGKLLAPIYESPFWYNLMMKVIGGSKAPSLKVIVKNVVEKMSLTQGYILDIATGTATYGRHVAGDRRKVYGVDISFEMLNKGRKYIKKEKRQNIQLARCDAMKLPFATGFFDGCLFLGSLHIFNNTEGILAEVNKVLKPGALMVVTTLIRGDKGILKNGKSKPHQKIFELSYLESVTKRAGFDSFQYQAFGCLIMFTVKKQHFIAD